VGDAREGGGFTSNLARLFWVTS